VIIPVNGGSPVGFSEKAAACIAVFPGLSWASRNWCGCPGVFTTLIVCFPALSGAEKSHA
jgi:hypothetical protein